MENTEPTTPQAVEQSAVSTPVDREAKAFETHVIQNQIQVPDNFKSVGDWFSALKSAQKEYTKARQEISDLKKQIPAATPEAPEQPKEAPAPVIPEELRIPDKLPEQPPSPQQTEILTKDEWNKYSTEVAVNGTLSNESREAIKTKTKLPDYVIDDFLAGQKARLQQAYGSAAEVVGGKDQLARVFDWASKNLSSEDQKSVNAALSSPSWEVALLGLNAKYQSAAAKKPTANEPVKAPSSQKVGATTATPTLGAYASKAEFYKDRRDPRFAGDPRFRQAVETRMAKTDFNSLR
jgi:hypothetical protein